MITKWIMHRKMDWNEIIITVEMTKLFGFDVRNNPDKIEYIMKTDYEVDIDKVNEMIKKEYNNMVERLKLVGVENISIGNYTITVTINYRQYTVERAKKIVMDTTSILEELVKSIDNIIGNYTYGYLRDFIWEFAEFDGNKFREMKGYLYVMDIDKNIILIQKITDTTDFVSAIMELIANGFINKDEIESLFNKYIVGIKDDIGYKDTTEEKLRAKILFDYAKDILLEKLSASK